MANLKPGDAKADVIRDQFDKNARDREESITRLEIRAQLREENEEEISSVIDQRLLENQQRKKESEPPAKEGVLAILLVPLRVKSGYQFAALVAVILGLVAALYLNSRR